MDINPLIEDMSNALEQMFKIHKELEDSLAVKVKISHEEVTRLVVMDLIAKRNSPTNKFRQSFDEVIRYYLTEDEFDKYVLDGEKIT